MTEAESEELARTRALQARLRESKIVLHRIMFLLGDVYNICGKTEEEVDAYDTAENLRKSILARKDILINLHDQTLIFSLQMLKRPPPSPLRLYSRLQLPGLELTCWIWRSNKEFRAEF